MALTFPTTMKCFLCSNSTEIYSLNNENGGFVTTISDSSSNSKHTECPTCKCTLKETTILAEDWRRLSSEEKLQLKREFANGKHIKSSLYNDNNKEKTDSSSFSKADEIRKFKDLLDEGAITEEEYERAKAKLLS